MRRGVLGTGPPQGGGPLEDAICFRDLASKGALGNNFKNCRGVLLRINLCTGAITTNLKPALVKVLRWI
jgi:hypothetical protein